MRARITWSTLTHRPRSRNRLDTAFATSSMGKRHTYGTHDGAAVVGTCDHRAVPRAHTQSGGVLPAAVCAWDGARAGGRSALHHGWADGGTRGVGGCGGVLLRALPGRDR